VGRRDQEVAAGWQVFPSLGPDAEAKDDEQDEARREANEAVADRGP
jgi:hypothetical protein